MDGCREDGWEDVQHVHGGFDEHEKHREDDYHDIIVGDTVGC